MQKISGYELICYAVASAVYGECVGISVKMPVKAVFYFVLMQHLKDIEVTVIGINRRIMQEHYRFKVFIKCRSYRKFKADSLSCYHLGIGGLAVVIYPAASAAYCAAADLIMVILHKAESFEAVVSPEFLDLAARTPPKVVIAFQKYLCAVKIFDELKIFKRILYLQCPGDIPGNYDYIICSDLVLPVIAEPVYIVVPAAENIHRLIDTKRQMQVSYCKNAQ